MKENITGMMVYYYFVCERKLWYFCHEITMETENEDVLLGKLLDESSYKKNDKHISIDQIINIDFMKEFGELHEVKKSKSVEEAGIWQMKYYLYYLQQRGVIGMKGKIDYPLLKKTMSVEITDEDCGEIEKIICEITQIKKMDIPPDDCNKKRCKKCAYYDLCFI